MADRVPVTSPAPGFPSSSFKYTPLLHVRVLFVKFVQGLFAEAPAGCYRWNEDDEVSEIIITNEGKLNPDVLNKRPGVTFTRGPITFYNLGIDDMVAYNMRTDRKHKGVLVPGTMTVNCVSRVTHEAENLAWIIAEHLWLLRDLLMRSGFFDFGRSPQIGAPSAAGSVVANDMGEEFYVVPVSIPWQFARDSAFTPLGKQIVSSIEQRLSTREIAAVRSEGYPYHAFEPGMQHVQGELAPFVPSATDARGGTPDPTGQRQKFLPKQRHPLHPDLNVTVRTVRPFSTLARSSTG